MFGFDNDSKVGFEELFLSCDCFSDEHILRYTYYQDDEWEELYTHIALHQYRNFWKRLWTGIKYIFGYESRYGHWDCVSLTKKDAIRLRDFLNSFLNTRKDECQK